MKVFTCKDHEGYWPVPTASVVVAKNKEEAKVLLSEELEKLGLNTIEFTLEELDINVPSTTILSDGDY